MIPFIFQLKTNDKLTPTFVDKLPENRGAQDKNGDFYLNLQKGKEIKPQARHKQNNPDNSNNIKNDNPNR